MQWRLTTKLRFWLTSSVAWTPRFDYGRARRLPFKDVVKMNWPGLREETGPVLCHFATSCDELAGGR